LAPAEKPVFFDPDSVAAYDVVAKGSVCFAADPGSWQKVSIPLKEKVGAFAASNRLNPFGISVAFDELVPNIVHYSLKDDPHKQLTNSWNFSKDGLDLSFSSECNEFFDPLANLFRDEEVVGAGVAHNPAADNPHLGTQIVLWFSDRLSFKWAIGGGDFLKLDVQKKPGVTADDFNSGGMENLNVKYTLSKDGTETTLNDHAEAASKIKNVKALEVKLSYLMKQD
jgi:hypothetical protein